MKQDWLNAISHITAGDAWFFVLLMMAYIACIIIYLITNGE